MKPDDTRTRVARRMHAPDNPERAALRVRLRELSRALLPLHRALIDAAKADYALFEKPVVSPAQLLALLTDDPFFAWLQPMTSLIVRIDELAAGELDPPEARRVLDAARDLIEGSQGSFSTQYREMLQRDVDVAVAHAAIKTVLSRA